MRILFAVLCWGWCTFSLAKCVPYPALIAEVEVASCQSFSVDSSLLVHTWEVVGDSVIHKPGVKHRATLLSGVVRSARFVSREPNQRMTHSFESYLPIGQAHLELSGEAAAVCPSKLPATVTVMADPRCCDILPSQGGCISPFLRVAVESRPSAWYRLLPPANER